MKRELVLALVIVGMVLWVPHASTAAAIQPASLQQEQVYGIASEFNTFYGLYWQNGTSEYDSGSSPWSYPVNFTSYSDLTYSSFQIGVSVKNFYQPMVVVSEGGTILLNNTGTGTFVVQPPLDTASIHVNVPAAFYPGGGIPAIGFYGMSEVGLLTIDYQTASPSTWAQSGTAETESLTLSAPTSVWLNQTTMYLPFPTPLAVNYSSASVTVNGNPYDYTQVTTNGIYVTDPNLAPGTSITFVATYSPSPTEVGNGPLVVINNFTSSGTSPTYSAVGTWINHIATLWGGIYIIVLNVPYTMDPGSVNISINGHYLKATSYLVSGNVVTILPLVYVTPLNGTDTFRLLFNLPTAPPSASLTVGSSTSFFGITISFGELLVGLIAVFIIGILIIWAPRYAETVDGRIRKNPVTQERLYLTFGLIGGIVVALVAFKVFW